MRLPRDIVPLVTITGGLIVLALILWQLMDVFLLAFAAIVVACILVGLGDLIRRFIPTSHSWSVAIAVVAILVAVTVFGVFAGAQVSGQAADLLQRLPEELSALGAMIGIGDLPERITRQLEVFAQRGNVLVSLAGYTTGFLGIAANTVLVAVAAVYLAQKPAFYRNGVLVLLPPAIRDQAASATIHAGNALRLWLLGQLASMVLVGAAVTIGLWIIGIPSALALGIFAGILEFVPLVGPIAFAIPGLLIAMPQGMTTFLWVLALYFGIQQVELNVIVPLVQRRAVDLPPALTLFSLLALSVLFGPLGLVLSTPLTVVIFVFVKELYVRGTLHQETDIPGEQVAPDA